MLDRFQLVLILNCIFIWRWGVQLSKGEDIGWTDHGKPDQTVLDKSICADIPAVMPRVYSASITDFGAVGDGTTLNTDAFQKAIFNLSTYSDEGGSTLHIPKGTWLTGSFNLTNHFTLYLEEGAVILGSQDPLQWPLIAPLPSYGRGRELPGPRHISLIYGENLVDVVITGQNGTVDGQGSIWWAQFKSKTLDYTRGHLLELNNSTNIVVTNITFLNSPFWTLHPVYCSNVFIKDVTILAPLNSPNTDGIDPDSSSNICIQDCYVRNGDDIISIKSGWDEYGIAFNRPSQNIVIQHVVGETHTSSGIAFGSEMSGGIEHVYVEDLTILNARRGIRFKTAAGRGGYIRNIDINNVVMHNVTNAIEFTGFYGEHPDGHYNQTAFSIINRISISNIVGDQITLAGNLQGLPEAPYTGICLNNVSLDVIPGKLVWNCSAVQGFSMDVVPEPCTELRDENASSLCSAVCYR
ncbi:hypothetical protein O6H91_Y184300 [Diphasiastrum complanatum]|nr:hypothetical protein O6H91_Y184300 [Diphasiastrum complanatum]